METHVAGIIENKSYYFVVFGLVEAASWFD